MLENAGVGLTVMVKFCGGPEQATELFVKAGVTVIIASTGEFPIFIALNNAIFPVPLAASPMAGLLFVQDKSWLRRSCPWRN